MPLPILQRYLADDPSDPEVVQLFADTQGYILASHHCDDIWHFFIRFEATADAQALRAKLAALPWPVTNTRVLLDRPKASPGLTVAVGLSSQGCSRLPIANKRFAADFQPFRRRALLVTSQSDSDWQPNWTQEPGYDAIVVCAAPEISMLECVQSRLSEHFEGLGSVHVEKGHVIRQPNPPPGHLRGRAIEHFGFVDGVSSPSILEHAAPSAPKDRNPSARAGLVLVPESPNPSYGSYMVFLKIEQHVEKFEGACRELASALHHTATPTAAQIEEAGSRIVGRKKDGCPLVVGGVDCSEQNDFGRSDDPKGAIWPYVSHTSKMNPRTGEDTRARILRRGVTYQDEDGGKGLLFVSFQSSYTNQFETHLSAWANVASHPFNRTGVDPIIGTKQPANQHFPGLTSPKNISGMATIRGGEYFYLPSISALTSLA